MTIKIRLQNVANFQDSGQFEIRPGINIFIGINNSGKSALLWALSMLGCAMREEKNTWAQLLLPPRMDMYRRGTSNPGVQIECVLPRESRDDVVGELCRSAGNSTTPPYDVTKETVEFNIRFNTSRQVCFVEPVRIYYQHENRRHYADVMNRRGANDYTVAHPFDAPAPNNFSPQIFNVHPYGADGGVQHFRFPEPRTGLAKMLA